MNIDDLDTNIEMETKVLQPKAGYLTGQLLLAMPSLRDSNFEKSVIYICSHDEKGAMGIVINQPLKSVDFSEVLAQLKLDDDAIQPGLFPDVHFGGPVEMTRGFVLHSTDHTHKDTILLNDTFGITATIDILQDIVTGQGPTDSIFALGYSGWGPGQLEQEMQANAWLSVDANPDLIFDTNVDDKWDQALAALGISPAQLSTIVGNA